MSLWIDVDTSNYKPHRQVELRMPSLRGYYYEIVWLKDIKVKKGDQIRRRNAKKDTIETWTVYELYGIRRM